LIASCINELENISLPVTVHSEYKHANTRPDRQLKQQTDGLLLEAGSLTDLAEAMGLSISTLQRKFKAAYGVTVNSYCRQRWLDIAKKAIRMVGKCLGEAACLAGYHHPSNFDISV
jgi:AraC-like DNA-binding protein